MYELPIDVDHGEAMLAVVGLRNVILQERGRILAPEWADIHGIMRLVEKGARDLVNGTAEDVSSPDLKYDAMLDAFSATGSPVALDDIINALPPTLLDSAGIFVGSLARAWNYLKAHFPISVEKTVTGVTNLPPSDYALGLFEDLLEIIDKPLSVFGMVQIGRLTVAQATALSSVYPELYKAIVGAIVLRIADQKGEHPKWECDWERGLAVLLAIPGVDPSLMALLQTPGPTQTNQPTPQEKEVAGKRGTSRSATRTQQIEANEPTD
jgi:hypothetical protein